MIAAGASVATQHRLTLPRVGGTPVARRSIGMGGRGRNGVPLPATPRPPEARAGMSWA
jgi:hypothetical protein